MLRDLQIEKIKNFLSPTPDLFWKILILDETTKKIISPLLKIKDLRDLGITTFFMIESKRDKITEIPAIYFIKPSRENLRIVKDDVIKNLYHGYYLNFLTKIEREDLEELGNCLSNKRLGFQIQTVFDQFIDFIALQNFLFILNKEIHSKKNNILDTEKNNSSNTNFISLETDILNSIFSVFLCLDQIPFIISENNELNEICNLLSKKIKNTNIIKKTNTRPLLYLYRREFDVFTPLEHLWSYNSLIHDLLKIDSNKVSFDEKSFEINDDFFLKYQNEYFPVVAKKIEEELLEHKKEMASRNIEERTDKKKIDEILEKLPELSRRNESIQAHMAICLKLVEIIKERKIDDFYRFGKEGGKDYEICDISNFGNEKDILRLCSSFKDKNKIDEILQKRKIKTNLFEFLKKYKDNTDHEIKAIYTRVASNIMGNVKKFLPGNTECPIYKEVESVFNNIKNQNKINLSVNDPLGNEIIYEKEINSIFVICIGGGTFNEFNSLKNLEKKLNIPIYYGCDNLINAEDYIDLIENENKFV
ncbi:Sec1 domain containing protein 1 [Gurleya vavrai]